MPKGQVSRGFFRFCAAVYATLIAGACLVRPSLSALDGGHLATASVALFAAACVGASTQALFAGRLGTAPSRGLLKAAAGRYDNESDSD